MVSAKRAWTMQAIARCAALALLAACAQPAASPAAAVAVAPDVAVAAGVVAVADAPEFAMDAAPADDGAQRADLPAVAIDQSTQQLHDAATESEAAAPADVDAATDQEADGGQIGDEGLTAVDAPLEAAIGDSADDTGPEVSPDQADAPEFGAEIAPVGELPTTPNVADAPDIEPELGASQDLAAVADAPQAEAADSATATADAVEIASPATSHNVLLVVSAGKPMPGQNLVVVVMAPGTPPPSPDTGYTPQWQGIVGGSWPMVVPLLLEPGSWQIGIEVKSGAVPGPPSAMGTICLQGKPALVGPTDAVQTFTVNLLPPINIYAVEDLCVAPKAPSAPPYLKTQSATQPPNTKDGGPHFMQALVFADRYWVAGSQDGYVSFDFPGGAAANQPFANWQVHGGQMCNRAIRVDDRLYCASRSGYVHILDLAPNQQPASLVKQFVSTGPTEGLMHRAGLIYVASHAKGLVAFKAGPPYSVDAVTAPADVTEAWDIAAIGSNHVAVANGAAGLVVGSLAGPGGPYDLQPAAMLPLPGVAAYLSLDGTTLAVGALGAGAHLVDVANPIQPKLLTTLQFGMNTYGVTLAGDHLFAAVGGALLVGRKTPDGWIVRGGLRSDSFALDVDLHGGGLLSAEFRTIRRTLIDPQAAAQGPVLVAPRTLTSTPLAVGATAPIAIVVRNLGSAPLTVAQILWQEQSMGGGGSLKFPGPWTVPAKGALSIPVVIKKSIKGLLEHQFIVVSDDPSQPEISVAHRETTWLHIGDKLPKLPIYADGKGNTTNIATHFFGQVGVLLVAAHSCPVAFQALAAARRDLGPLVAAGTIAAVAINPWDKPQAAEVAAFPMPFPVVYSGLTTSDSHDWSEVLDVTLGQPLLAGPPMPITYVVGKDGKLLLARWGYDSAEVLAAVAMALAK